MMIQGGLPRVNEGFEEPSPLALSRFAGEGE